MELNCLHFNFGPLFLGWPFDIFSFFFFLIYLLAALGLHCCSQTFSSCSTGASHCGGISCCRAQTRGYKHLVARWHMESALHWQADS